MKYTANAQIEVEGILTTVGEEYELPQTEEVSAFVAEGKLTPVGDVEANKSDDNSNAGNDAPVTAKFKVVAEGVEREGVAVPVDSELDLTEAEAAEYGDKVEKLA